MHKPTDILMREHEAIVRVLDAADQEVACIARTGKIHTQRVRELADFFRNFADRCHHAKEEKHLFAAMHARGMPMESGPLAVMLREHEQGRQCIRTIATAVAGEPSPGQAGLVKENLAAFSAMLRAHIQKEDNVLYTMANRILSHEDQAALLEAFDRVEAEELGEGVHEKYHAWMETLDQEPG